MNTINQKHIRDNLDKIQQDLIELKCQKIDGLFSLIIHLKTCNSFANIITYSDDNLMIKCMQTYKQALTDLLNLEITDAKMIEITWLHIINFEHSLRHASRLFDNLKLEWEVTVFNLRPSLLNNDVRNLCLANKFLEIVINNLQNSIYKSKQYIDLAEHYIEQFENSRITQLYKFDLSSANQMQLNCSNAFYLEILKRFEDYKKLFFQQAEKH